MSLLDFCTKPSSYTTGPGVSVVRKSWLGGQVHSLRSPFSDLQSISRPAPGRSAVREARERKVAGASFPARINASPAVNGVTYGLHIFGVRSTKLVCLPFTSESDRCTVSVLEMQCERSSWHLQCTETQTRLRPTRDARRSLTATYVL